MLPRLSTLTAGAALALAAPAPAAPPSPARVARLTRTAARLGRQAVPYLELVALADELTTHTAGPRAHTAGKPALESMHLEARFRVPVVAEDHLTNSLLSLEVPGRRVSVRLRVECVVHCTLDLAGFRTERRGDTVTVRLPEVETHVSVHDGEPAWVVQYGRLRSRWLDADRADLLGRRLLEAARARAAEEFRRDWLPALRRALADAVEGELRARHPGLRARVR